MRFGLIYDRQIRPDTTGCYLHNAISQYAETIHLQPGQSLMNARHHIDFYIVVDDGLDYEIPNHLRPRAAWAIDTHLGFRRCLNRFGDAELLFAAQNHDAYRLSEALGRNVIWLPLACDPAAHRPIPEVAVDHDVVFVGNIGNPQRQRWLAWLARHFPRTWTGQAYFAEMSRAWSRGKIGFNYSVAGDVNMRIFEIAACGLPVVTNRLFNNGLESLFDVQREIVLWESEEDLLQKIEQLLADEPQRLQIARAGYEAVLGRHTYSHRAAVMLEKLGAWTPDRPRPVGYFEHDRPDVRALIPESATNVLDIGCGSGRLGAILRRQRSCRVAGIEPCSRAAARARQALNEVVCRPIDEIPASHFPEESFDCIVLADVLEHLRDPLSALKKCAAWLSANGTLVISIPNSRNFEVLQSLADGNWTYESAGILDEDHVRTLTRRELEKLLFRSGFSISRTHMVYSHGIEKFRSQSFTGSLRLGNLTVEGLSRQDAEELYGYQILMTGTKSIRPSFGRTSVIIVTFNQLAYTRLCVESVLTRTDEPIELIFVDNGSTDGTVEYLQSLSRAKVVHNRENLGFAPAVNQGLQLAHGDQILLLNNDCVVTTGWLNALLEVLHSSPTVGMVGPVSNHVSGQQQVAAGYSVLSALDGFAWERLKIPEQQPTTRLVGFCLLFRRRVLETIGGLDERFRVGCYEDDDFCRRALAAGFELRIARHVFVHHFGHVTFQGSGISLATAMQENGQRFAEKWGVASVAQQPIKRPSGTPDRVSLCMIVRDNETIIEACLNSIRPWVDEMIVVDTGSTDRTPEICRTLGARVFEFPWCDDFSAARNESLKYATGDWIFWMDSDDLMDAVQGTRLRDLVKSSHAPECLGYVLQVHCPSGEGGQATIVDHVKLFRNRNDLRFEHRIHEQILPAIRRAGGKVEFRDIHVVHQGSRLSPEQRRRKLKRDFRILLMDLEEHPDHPFILFNLGMTCDDAGFFSKAISYMQRCISVSQLDESHVRKAWAILVNSLRSSGAVDDALSKVRKALNLYPDDVELKFRLGVLLQQTGQYKEAVRAYREILEAPRIRRFQSMDNSIIGYKLHHNLALALDQLQCIQEAAAHWDEALVCSPQCEVAVMEVARHAHQARNTQRLTELVKETEHHPNLILRSRVTAISCAASGRWDEVRTVLWEAWRASRDEVCLDDLARLMIEHHQAAEALPALEELVKHRPECPATHFNLGQALLSIGQMDAARVHLMQSLRLRPNHSATLTLLASLPHVKRDE